MKSLSEIKGRKIIFLAIFMSQIVFADDNQSKEMLEKYNKSVALYKTEASKLSASEIYEEIQKSGEALRLKSSMSKSAWPDIEDKDLQKSTAYATVIEERRNKNDPEAAFYYGLYLMKICSVVKENGSGEVSTNKNCTEALESMSLSAKANDPRAMQAIGIIYREGLGVNKSKFVAADWFVKSAKQYQKENYRDAALAALEEALAIVPEHNSALKMKNELFSQ